jgi:hypothetical protein
MRLIDADELKKQLEHYRYAICGFEGVLGLIDNAPKFECRTCRHRDPEDKKCEHGGLERQGCQFPVSDDYFCKFYEKGGTHNGRK